MSEQRLHASGMKVSEALRKARQWWDQLGGRQNMSRQLNETSNQEELGRRFTPSNGTSAAILIPGDKEAVCKSGILRGLPWDELTRREQLAIVKTWHQEYVVSPLMGMAGDLKSKQ